MKPREFFAKRKAHIILAGAFLSVLTFNIILGFRSGNTVLGATWQALSEIRLMDYLMFALFWYALAVHRPKDDWESSLITLNLSESNNYK